MEKQLNNIFNRNPGMLVSHSETLHDEHFGEREPASRSDISEYENGFYFAGRIANIDQPSHLQLIMGVCTIYAQPPMHWGSCIEVEHDNECPFIAHRIQGRVKIFPSSQTPSNSLPISHYFTP